MTSFIFVRHGKSQANKDHLVGGNETLLTKEGKAQARKVGRQLKAMGITKVVSSPLPRAIESAELIAKQLKLDDVLIIDELRERGLGNFETAHKDHESVWYFTVDGQAGVEPINDAVARTIVALQKIKELSAHDKVLVVGHAVSGYYLQQLALGKRRVEDFVLPLDELTNAEYVEITITDPPKFALPFTRLQALLLAAAVVAFILAAMLALAPAPSATQQSQNPGAENVPMSIDDFNESPSLREAVQKQIQGQQSGRAEQPQSSLQQTAPSLQGPATGN